MESIINLVVFAGFVQGIFLTALVIASGRKPRVKLPLAGLLAAFSLSLGHSQTIVSIIRLESFPAGGRVIEPSQLLFGPLLYIFCRNLAGSGKAFRPYDLLHAAPFAGAVLLYLSGIAPGEGSMCAGPAAGVSFGRVFVLVAVLQFLAYLSRCHTLVTRWRAHVRDEIAIDVSADFAWLYALMAGLGILYLASVPLLFWYFHGGPAVLNEVLSILASALVFAIGFRALGAGMDRLIALPAESPAERYRNSPLDEASSRALHERLCALMESERPFTDPEVSLSVLAARLETASYKLSQAINENSGKNFSELINAYRVEEVKRLLAGAGGEGFTLLDIAFEAGFNSKPTFNKVFKRMTGLTPSRYFELQKK